MKDSEIQYMEKVNLTEYPTEAGMPGTESMEADVPGTESMAANSPAKGSQTSDPTGTDPRKENADVEALIALLDGCTQAGESRIKLDVVEGGGEVLSRKYHHGRCDVGSPWACGTAFDVLE